MRNARNKQSIYTVIGELPVQKLRCVRESEKQIARGACSLIAENFVFPRFWV